MCECAVEVYQASQGGKEVVSVTGYRYRSVNV